LALWHSSSKVIQIFSYTTDEYHTHSLNGTTNMILSAILEDDDYDTFPATVETKVQHKR